MRISDWSSDVCSSDLMTRVMAGKTPGAVRAQLGRFGFSGARATTEVGKLSGGERARLALALITREAPHLLILDEPTNHLDVDAREALVQALNGFRSEEQTSELQSLMRISYAVFCLKKKPKNKE